MSLRKCKQIYHDDGNDEIPYENHVILVHFEHGSDSGFHRESTISAPTIYNCRLSDAKNICVFSQICDLFIFPPQKWGNRKIARRSASDTRPHKFPSFSWSNSFFSSLGSSPMTQNCFFARPHFRFPLATLSHRRQRSATNYFTLLPPISFNN